MNEGWIAFTPWHPGRSRGWSCLPRCRIIPTRTLHAEPPGGRLIPGRQLWKPQRPSQQTGYSGVKYWCRLAGGRQAARGREGGRLCPIPVNASQEPQQNWKEPVPSRRRGHTFAHTVFCWRREIPRPEAAPRGQRFLPSQTLPPHTP